MMSTCSQSAPCSMVREHAAPSSAKSADKMDGAMIAFGAMLHCDLFLLYWMKNEDENVNALNKFLSQ